MAEYVKQFKLEEFKLNDKGVLVYEGEDLYEKNHPIDKAKRKEAAAYDKAYLSDAFESSVEAGAKYCSENKDKSTVTIETKHMKCCFVKGAKCINPQTKEEMRINKCSAKIALGASPANKWMKETVKEISAKYKI